MTTMVRPLRSEESERFWQLAFSDPKAEWTRWNGPYFQDVLPSRNEFLATVESRWLQNPYRQVITVDHELVGSVSAYYDDGNLHRWLEVGIVLYNNQHWGQHIGRVALAQWLDWWFENTDLPHIGFTTWSGNQRMMRLGDRLGMQLEGRIRQVRYWQSQYYDSIKYGILRDEWCKR